MNYEILRKKMATYIFAVLAVVAGCCSFSCLLFACIMVIGVLAGEWALLHLLAMFVITCCAVICALFLALYEAAGGKVPGAK